MGQQVAGPWPGTPVTPEQKKRQKAALRQVEWAETYLQAVESLEVEDNHTGVLLGQARQALVALELRLRRLAAS